MRNLYFIEEEQNNGSKITIDSISSCLEILTQCHETINEQDASSSSDSDSDPEGGELPDILYSKEKEKKKTKKKRSEKAVEEHVEKLNPKQQVFIIKNIISHLLITNLLALR